VIKRGNTEFVKSFGSGRDERKLLLPEGIVDEEAKSRLYVDMLELVCNGEVCGEL